MAKTFVQCLQDLGAALGLREVEFGRDLRGVIFNEARHGTGHEGQVKGELAGRHGSFVRLPGQLVFGETLEETARDGRLGFEFDEHGFSDGVGSDDFCNGHSFDPPWE